MENNLDTDIDFKEGVSDDDLIKQCNNWIKESQSYHDYLLKKQQSAYEYYIGNQTFKSDVPDISSNTVENRVFEGVETLVPIATSNAHHFVVMPGEEDEMASRRATKLQKVMDVKYRTLFLQRKGEEAVRHMLLFRFGAFKWCWDYETDDIDVKVVHPQLMLVPKLMCDPHDLPYKIEIQEYAPEDATEQFPEFDKWDEIKPVEGQISKLVDKSESKKVYQVFEIWTKDYTVWYSNKHILKKETNPYFDYDEPKNNFLDDPRDPFVFLTTFNTGNEPFGDLSLVEAVMDIQDEINVQKRQIIDNLRQMGNSQLFMDKDAMSKEEAESITNETGLIVMGDELVSGKKYKREAPVPLPTAHFANLQDSKTAFDNVFGLHSATRGAAASKTLGQDIINRQQDLTRIDMITRVLNRSMQRLAEGMIQLMKMFYTEAHVFKYLGAEGAVEFVRLSSRDIANGTEVIVKTGRSPEYDRSQLGQIGVQLFQLSAISPADLYRLLELPNPEELEINLLKWKMGQLSAETEADIARSRAGAQAKAQATPSPQGEGRGVETQQNSIQRSRQQVQGQAPLAGGVPKV